MPADVPAIVLGSLRVSGPERVPSGRPGGSARWRVTAVDSVLEDVAEKVFTSRTAAQAFIDELATGHAPVDPLADDPDAPARTTELAGKDAQRTIATATSPAQLNGKHTRPEPGKGGPGQSAKDAARAPFNLKAVAEALVEAELDPFVEVARVLQEQRPIFNRDGTPQMDEATGLQRTERVINGLDRAKILVELGQYVAPKLKAVEMKVEDKRTLSQEQLDQRIADLIAKGHAPQAVTGNG